MSQPLVVSSEVAHDLLLDNLDTLLVLLDHPVKERDLVARLGSQQTLERMLKHGLLVRDGEALKPKAEVFQVLRQEGMMSFLSRYVLPALTDSAEGDSTTALHVLTLKLSQKDMLALRQGRVAELFDGLTKVSDQPAQEPLYQLKIQIVGTSRLERQELPAGESALVHTKLASLQRATPEEKDLAVLTQINFLADEGRFQSARAAIAKFVQSLERESSPLASANYHLTVACHWSIAQDQDGPVHGDAVRQ